MNPVLKNWGETKLVDMLNSMYIFNTYLTIPRKGFVQPQKEINLVQAKYVVEQIYCCRLQCEKCIMKTPTDFITFVDSYFKTKSMTITRDSIDYIYKWLNTLINILMDKSPDEFKDEKTKQTKRNKMLKIIEKRRAGITELENKLKSKMGVKEHRKNLRDEMLEGLMIDALSFGSYPKLTRDELEVLAKYRSEQELSDPKMSLLSLQIFNSLPEDPELSESELRLIANLRTGHPLNDDGSEFDQELEEEEDTEQVKKRNRDVDDIDKTVNVKDLRGLSRMINTAREEARGKMPAVSETELFLKSEYQKYEDEINKLKEIDTDTGSDYEQYIKDRIQMFQTYKLETKNYGLNTDAENNFVSSVAHLLNKLTSWLNIKNIEDNEIRTIVKLILPSHINVSRNNISRNDQRIQILIGELQKRGLSVSESSLDMLGNILNNLNDVLVIRRLEFFSHDHKFKAEKTLMFNNKPLPSFLKADKKEFTNYTRNAKGQYVN